MLDMVLIDILPAASVRLQSRARAKENLWGTLRWCQLDRKPSHGFKQDNLVNKVNKEFSVQIADLNADNQT